MYKKVNVVMLPTNEKATDRPFSVGITLCNDGKLRIGNPVGYSEKRQHLYITSDEEIKEGDWYYNLITNSIHKADLILSELNPAFKKIISTTNSSLKFGEDVPGIIRYKLLPQLPQQFIQQYIEKYNKSNVITEVLIEYDFADHDLALFRDEITLKVNHDNTINIKPIKDSWNREEVIKILNKFAYDVAGNGMLITSQLKVNEFWIKENL